MSLDPSQSHWGPTGTHHHLQICVCNAHRHAVHDTRMHACGRGKPLTAQSIRITVPVRMSSFLPPPETAARAKSGYSVLVGTTATAAALPSA